MSAASLIKFADGADLEALLHTYAGMPAGDADRGALARQIVDTAAMTLFDLESEIKQAADVERAATARKRAFQMRLDQTEKAIQAAMEFAGEKELAGATSTLKLQATPASVVITDLEAIPAGFRTIVPASWTPNKVAIKNALKAGQAVAGADLSEGNMRLVWK